MSITGFLMIPDKSWIISCGHNGRHVFSHSNSGCITNQRKTGLGQYIDTAMVDCIFAILENATVRYTVSGEVPQRIGSRHPSLTPFDVFKTLDGYMVIGIGNDNLWEVFVRVSLNSIY